MNTILTAILGIIAFVSFTNSRSTEEHPRYTAARLTDEYKHILDGRIKLADSHIFTDDISVDDCGKGGDYEYLSNKLEELIPKLGQVDLSVKFAYPVPFTNHSIQFSVDEVLTLLNGEVQSGEKAFFARMEDKDNEYKIYDIRVVPCDSQ
uniref:Secreted protein n=1 Tax=Caenorhabditis tropicalis TaxID=1561998 RepID=A0A1I7UCM7_9PELO